MKKDRFYIVEEKLPAVDLVRKASLQKIEKTETSGSNTIHFPERMTVNHDVTGSSPVGGATKKHLQKQVLFLPFLIELYSNQR